MPQYEGQPQLNNRWAHNQHQITSGQHSQRQINIHADMDESDHGDGYMSRVEFITYRMEYSKCPRGRDLSPDQRHCGMCSEAISDTSAVAKICPQSDGHVFHWLCMLQWLATWIGGEFCRSCPTCRAELYQMYPGSLTLQPSEEAESLRTKISDAWKEVFRHRCHGANFAGFDFIERRFHESGTDRITSLKLSMYGFANRAVLMGFLADSEGVEIQRSGAYITDYEVNLRNLLHTPLLLLGLLKTTR